MTEVIIDVLSWICLIGGSLMSIIGGIGLLRLPDLFSRMHAAGITDTMGAGLILTGLMFQAGLGLETVKLIMILYFIILTSPTSTHALAEAAIGEGVRPDGYGEHAGKEGGTG